ncbi:hypothetical protein [Methanohalophilus halophilus]|nr:hypothetical protein [Methanohalophilus halophilus]APH39725.1 hypothetical protein BHR79_09695 [Methanohalophilus halophilus]SDW37550.1 hypothetical protein SAMN04515625_0858 [Methanohalophilus halophilus]
MVTLLGHGLTSSVRYMLESMPEGFSLAMRVYMLTHESNLLFHGVTNCDQSPDGYWLAVAYYQDGKQEVHVFRQEDIGDIRVFYE